MDTTLFRILNAAAGHGALTDGLIVFLASYLQYVSGAVLVASALWPRRRWHMLAAGLGAGIIARMGVKTLLLMFIHRARPFVALTNVHNLGGVSAGEEFQSFPSGHALFFFAVAMAVYRYDKRLGCILFTSATVMGVARVMAGVHYPGDILAGALIGIAVGWLTVQLIPPLRRTLPTQV